MAPGLGQRAGMPRCRARPPVTNPICRAENRGTAPDPAVPPSGFSMVEFAAGPGRRRPGRVAGSASCPSQNACTAGRSEAGAASMRRCRRPAANRSAWSVGSARCRSTKKSCSPRASDPIDRPGRRARSSTACGWFGLLVGQQLRRACRSSPRRGPGSAGRRDRRRSPAATPAGRPVPRSGVHRGPAAGRGHAAST